MKDKFRSVISKINKTYGQKYKILQEKELEFTKLKQLVKKPIFIFGVPRSGTTAVYNFLCFNHPDLAYFSNEDLKNWYSETEKEFIKKRFTNLHLKHENVPKDEDALFHFGSRLVLTEEDLSENPRTVIPIEGNKFWEKFFYNIYAKDTSIDNKIQIAKQIISTMESMQKLRFVNKSPLHSTRLFALKKIFPDAKFINVCRDPRPVVYSMLQRIKKEENFGVGIPIKDKQTYEKLAPLERCAWIYKEFTDAIHQFLLSQNNSNFLTIMYEEFVTNHENELKKIFDFCELEIPKSSNMAGKINQAKNNWQKELDPKDQKKILDIVRPSMQKMNYTYQIDK